MTSCARFVSASITAFVLAFSCLLTSPVRGEDLELEPVEFDADTLQAVTNLARSISGVNANTVTVEDNVAAILSILQLVYNSGTFKSLNTFPKWNSNANYSMGTAFSRLLSESDSSPSIPSRDSSFLFEIQRALLGQSGIPSQNDSLLPTLWRIEDILSASGSGGGGGPVAITNDAILGFFNANQFVDSGLTWGYIWQYLTDSARYVTDVYEGTAWEADEYDSALRVVDAVSAYYLGQLTDNSVTLSTQLDDIIDKLQGITGAYAEALGTNTVIAGDVERLRQVVEQTNTVGQVDDHFTASYDFSDEDIRTNRLESLRIEQGDTGDLSPVLDLVDPDSFDVLPSLTGGNPVVEVFTASRDSPLPAFSVDFSLPSGFQTFIHTVAVWLWRLLFFVAMWGLVSCEFNYWSTLGGSASA